MKILSAVILFVILNDVQARLGEQFEPNDGGDREGVKSSKEAPVKLSERNLEMDEVPVLVKYKTKEAEERTEALSNSVGAKLKRVKTVAARVQKSKLKDLEDDPEIEYVELDEMLYPYSTKDTIPYGIRAVY